MKRNAFTKQWSVLVLAAAIHWLVGRCAPVMAQVATNNGGWPIVDFDKQPLASFMVAEAPNAAQLKIARDRTAADTKLVVQNSNWTNESSVLRRAARARWLQLNLEYQAYLTSKKEDRQALATEIRSQYRALSDIIWHTPEIDPLNRQPTSVSLMTASENMEEWESARQFMETIYNEVKTDLPTELVHADTIVRRAYFHLMSPSRNSADDNDPNRKIQKAYEKSFKGLQNLGKEAVAAKVQAAVVMRRFYGTKPNDAYASFDTTKIEKAILEEKGQTNVRLDIDQGKLFAARKVDRDRIHNLVQEVTTGDPAPGVVENYRELNITLDAATKSRSEINQGVGWNGLVSEFANEGDTHLGAITYPGDLEQPNAKPLARVIARVDEAYGFVVGAKKNDASGSAQTMVVVPLRKTMQLANEKTGEGMNKAGPNDTLFGRILAWRKNPSPLPASHLGNQTVVSNGQRLDDLIEYDPRASVAEGKYGENEEARRITRSWFECLVKSATVRLQPANQQVQADAECKEYKVQPTLEFASSKSGELPKAHDRNVASAIPEISLPDNSPPTKTDQFIRAMANSDIVATRKVLYSRSITKKNSLSPGDAPGA